MAPTSGHLVKPSCDFMQTKIKHTSGAGAGKESMTAVTTRHQRVERRRYDARDSFLRHTIAISSFRVIKYSYSTNAARCQPSCQASSHRSIPEMLAKRRFDSMLQASERLARWCRVKAKHIHSIHGTRG